MGASLAYLKEPIKDIEQETGENKLYEFATGSMQGWRLNMVSTFSTLTHLQEDSHIANLKFQEDDNKQVFGVFDGHGGREVAVYCDKNYMKILADGKNQEEDTKEWLRTSFMNVDVEITKPEGQDAIGNLRREKPPAKPPLLQILDQNKPEKTEPQTNEELNLDSIGCTANVIYMDKTRGKFWVVNAGDSRCTMGRDGKCVELSVDHKPECPIEIARIEKAGSVITDGRVDGNLNLTRSLGDMKYKQKEGFTPEEQPITANPDVLEFDLTDDIDFIIMGCDGIWERKSNEEMVEYVYEKLKEEKTLKETVSDLLLDTIAPSIAETQGIGCDNMTCVLIKFLKPTPQ